MEVSMNRLNSSLRKRAPFTFVTVGIGLIWLGFVLQVLGQSPMIMATLGLEGTVFGLLSKLGGPFVFAGLFAFAVRTRPDTRTNPVAAPALPQALSDGGEGPVRPRRAARRPMPAASA
jgi:hypothetical protein